MAGWKVDAGSGSASDKEYGVDGLSAWWELTTGSRMLCEELSVITSLMVHINA